MSEKKNIDKLFKEHFKNFEAAPSDAVWENIEAALNTNKRKRRVIPMWWKVAGVAAALLLMFTVANSVINDSDSSVKNKIVDTETSTNSPKIDDTTSKGSDLNTSEDLNTNPIVESEKNSEEKIKKNTSNSPQNNPISTNLYNNKTRVTISEGKDKKRSENRRNDAHPNRSIINNKLVTRDALVFSETKSLKNKKELDSSTLLNKNSVLDNSKEITSINQYSIDAIKEKLRIDKLIKQNKREPSTQMTSSKGSDKARPKTKIDTSNTLNLHATENAIEMAIAQIESTDTEKTKDTIDSLSKRWSIAPNMAPVYFNTLGNGSPIDEQFVDNSKEGEVNVSYGVKGAYVINKKFTIRAGVNKVNLGYSTNNVVAFARPNASASSRELQHINFSNTNTTYLSADNISFATGPEVLLLKEQGSINQQLGFIEVPIELEYIVLDTKIGVNLIGGFSTLFLSDNAVYSVEKNGVKTRLGEASNINNMSYSANIGVGFNYTISKQLQFNLEPMFKYQLNTFSDTSGNFQPFFIGVYTGLSFKF